MKNIVIVLSLALLASLSLAGIALGASVVLLTTQPKAVLCVKGQGSGGELAAFRQDLAMQNCSFVREQNLKVNPRAIFCSPTPTCPSE